MEPAELMGTSLVDSFTSYDPAQITPDLLEVALDSVLEDGIIRDIPVVRTIAGVLKAAASIRDRALVKKLVNFLSSAIDRAFYTDLISFLKAEGEPYRLSPQARLELSYCGVIELLSTPSINLSSKNNKYQITELGRTLLKYVHEQ